MHISTISARSLFEDDHMSIAIGPYIDVFTSIQYVIQKQVHIVTSSIEKPEPSKRTFPILPDANSMSSAIAKIVKRLNWKKVAFLSQGISQIKGHQLKHLDIYVTYLKNRYQRGNQKP